MPPRKRRSTGSSKKKTQSRSIAIAIGAIALLILLVSLSIFTLTGSNDKKVVKNTTQTQAQKPPQTQTQAPEPQRIKDNISLIDELDSSKDISSLIRLVLYDFEISRSNVDERITTTAKGKSNLYFTIKYQADANIPQMVESLQSVLAHKNYKAKTSGHNIKATGADGVVEIVFSLIETEPKKSQNQNQHSAPSSSSARPKAPEASDIVVKLAILLDDGGSNIQLAERFAAMKYPVALAVLPHLKYSNETARVVSAYKKTLFLHFPMEPKSYPSVDPGKGAVLLSMPAILIEGVAKSNFDSLGVPVDGVNNHMGSALTEDSVKMAQIMNIVKQHAGTFVDSRTTPNSVAYDECLKAGLKCGINKRFLDNDNDVNAIIAKIYEAAELAKKNGDTLVIGHLRKNTLDALDIALPILETLNIAIVPVSAVVR